jgi:hypothetical protein
MVQPASLFEDGCCQAVHPGMVCGGEVEPGARLANQFVMRPAEYLRKRGIAVQYFPVAGKHDADRGIFQNGLVLQQRLRY